MISKFISIFLLQGFQCQARAQIIFAQWTIHSSTYLVTIFEQLVSEISLRLTYTCQFAFVI